MFNKLKDLIMPFKDGDSPDLSRRKLIRTAGALAALTVVGTRLPSLLKIKSIEEQIAYGFVENQTFYLTEPIVISMDNVVIRNCRFIATKPMPYMIHINGAANTVLADCYLDNRLADTAIQFDNITNQFFGKVKDIPKRADIVAPQSYLNTTTFRDS